MADKRGDRRATSFDRAAHALGLVDHGGAVREGAVEGRRVRLAIEEEVSAFELAFAVALSPPLDLGLSLEWHDSTRFRAAFDEEERGRPFLDLARETLAVAPGTFTVTDDTVDVRFRVVAIARPPEFDHRVLVAGARMALVLAHRFEELRGRTSVAAPLAPFLASAAAYAETQGVTLMTCPLALFGNVGDMGLAVAAERIDEGRHTIRARLWPSPPPSAELVAFTAGTPNAGVLDEASRFRLDDPPFDEAFVVYARSRANARVTLTAAVRRALLELRARYESVVLEGERVELPAVALDRSRPHLFGEVADALLEAGSRFSPSKAGPYR